MTGCALPIRAGLTCILHVAHVAPDRSICYTGFTTVETIVAGRFMNVGDAQHAAAMGWRHIATSCNAL